MQEEEEGTSAAPPAATEDDDDVVAVVDSPTPEASAASAEVDADFAAASSSAAPSLRATPKPGSLGYRRGGVASRAAATRSSPYTPGRATEEREERNRQRDAAQYHVRSTADEAPQAEEQEAVASSSAATADAPAAASCHTGVADEGSASSEPFGVAEQVQELGEDVAMAAAGFSEAATPDHVMTATAEPCEAQTASSMQSQDAREVAVGADEEMAAAPEELFPPLEGAAEDMAMVVELDADEQDPATEAAAAAVEAEVEDAVACDAYELPEPEAGDASVAPAAAEEVAVAPAEGVVDAAAADAAEVVEAAPAAEEEEDAAAGLASEEVLPMLAELMASVAAAEEAAGDVVPMEVVDAGGPATAESAADAGTQEVEHTVDAGSASPASATESVSAAAAAAAASAARPEDADRIELLTQQIRELKKDLQKTGLKGRDINANEEMRKLAEELRRLVARSSEASSSQEGEAGGGQEAAASDEAEPTPMEIEGEPARAAPADREAAERAADAFAADAAADAAAAAKAAAASQADATPMEIQEEEARAADTEAVAPMEVEEEAATAVDASAAEAAAASKAAAAAAEAEAAERAMDAFAADVVAAQKADAADARKKELANLLAKLREADERSDVEGMESTLAAIADVEAAAADLAPEDAQFVERTLAKASLISALEKAELSLVQAALQEALVVDLFAGSSRNLDLLERAESLVATEERKKKARAALAQAVQDRDVEALKKSLEEVSAAGLPEDDEEVVDARMVQEEEETAIVRRAAAREALVKVCEFGEVDVIRAAIEEAVDAGIAEEELGGAREALAREERKDAARKALQESCDSGSTQKIQAALEEATAAGLDDCEDSMQSAFDARKTAALADAKKATEERSIEDLRAAIAMAMSIDLSTEEEAVKAAIDALAEEERKVAARAGLEAAVAERSIDALEKALAEGQEAALTEEEMASATSVLAEEKFLARQRAARQGLSNAVASRVIEEVKAAIAEAEASELKEDEISAARTVLAEEERKVRAREALSQESKAGDMAKLQAAIEEGYAAGLVEDELQEALAARADLAREALRKAVEDAGVPSPDGKEEAAAADDRRIESLQSVLEQGYLCGLAEADLEAANAALAEATRTKWRRILQADPFDFGVPALLGTMSEILRMGFQLDFIKDWVLRRVTDGGGQRPIDLAQHLQRLRADNLAELTHNDPPTAQAVESAFLEGIQRASARRSPPVEPPAKPGKAFVWLDLSAAPASKAPAEDEAPKQPFGLEGSSDGFRLFPSSCEVPLQEVCKSSLLTFELRLPADAPLDLCLCVYDSIGNVIWSVMPGGEPFDALGSSTIVAAWREVDAGSKSRKKPMVFALDLDLDTFLPDVFSICIVGQAREGRGLPDSASLCLREVGEVNRQDFMSLFSRRRRPSDRLLGNRRLALPLDRVLGTASPTEGYLALVSLCRHASSATADHRGAPWFLHSSGDGTGVEDAAGSPSPAALSSFLGRLMAEKLQPEAVLLKGAFDENLPACVSCCELRHSFGAAMGVTSSGGSSSSSSSAAPMRCVATGVLWKTGKPAAVDVSLTGNLLEDLRIVMTIKARFDPHTSLDACDGFEALCDQVEWDPPGEGGVFVRVGGVPEMPLARIRGTWGFDKARLCAFDMRSVDSPFQETAELSASPPAAASEKSLGSLCEFLTGELTSRPDRFAGKRKLAELLGETSRLSREEVEDERHVLWIPGCAEDALGRFSAGLRGLKRPLSPDRAGAAVAESQAAVDAARGVSSRLSDSWVAAT
eukprot:TRINITY_DN22334_c0_g1_i1.p1 TRINITY_DN22334_c0_g1~~TRINITY_DN22334_c0_g1_i1.p1  ORF type:complete len:1771 (+),score=655.46 TRINITY_DN22334_c0_g1_i1:149-5461(+)